jgi:pSer/pThr/pTyr-binding forkhead associated (FHA) protein
VSEDLLTLLKYVFLALLFLFLWAVVRVVIRELREPALAPTGTGPTAPTTKPKKAAAPKSFATLRVLAPESRRGEVVPIDNEITVGRGGGCALVLADDQYASTVHARVFKRGNDLFVDDLESRNGTFVNGKRISSTTKVRRGDQIQFGGTVCDVTR